MQLDPKDSHRGKYYKRENDHCILEIPVSKFKKCPGKALTMLFFITLNIQNIKLS